AQGSVDHVQAQIADINVGIAKTQLWAQELQRDADVQAKNDLNSVTGPFSSQAKSQANQIPSDTAENSQIQAKDYGVSIAQSNLEGAQNQTGNQGAISSAQAQVVAAQNALSKLLEGGNKQDVAGANANIQAAQSALDQAKATLYKLNLVAPFDGVVAQMNLNVGQQTPPGAAAIILDTSAYYVDLPVDEVDIAKVALDQDATLKFDSLPGVVLNGKVTRISDTGTKAGSVVTYTVRVQIDPAGKPLLSSMTTTVSIITGKVTGVLLIPNRYVRIDRSSGKAYATVRQADNSYKEVEIVLGLRNDTVTEVKSGLNAGDTLIPPQLQNNLSFGPPPGGGPGA
ncbi:MAG TPA: efflux RND transporter periplasmic adaptor subunit, partial [Aggregatilineales bacterium]|nr:efflux RND transporter periplasmic adaptor subunit [Aggregatilineales bacterium]